MTWKYLPQHYWSYDRPHIPLLSFSACSVLLHLLLQSPEEVFMEIRRPLEWHCKQMDHFVGLNFSANFNFALVGHLLKGKDSWNDWVWSHGCVCHHQLRVGHYRLSWALLVHFKCSFWRRRSVVSVTESATDIMLVFVIVPLLLHQHSSLLYLSPQEKAAFQTCWCICCPLTVPPYLYVFYVSPGYRHPSATTVARTVRILHTLLALISKHLKCDKFEVNTQSVAYLAGM